MFVARALCLRPPYQIIKNDCSSSKIESNESAVEPFFIRSSNYSSRRLDPTEQHLSRIPPRWWQWRGRASISFAPRGRLPFVLGKCMPPPPRRRRRRRQRWENIKEGENAVGAQLAIPHHVELAPHAHACKTTVSCYICSK